MIEFKTKKKEEIQISQLIYCALFFFLDFFDGVGPSDSSIAD